jgi:hypothetical protein
MLIGFCVQLDLSIVQHKLINNARLSLQNPILSGNHFDMKMTNRLANLMIVSAGLSHHALHIGYMSLTVSNAALLRCQMELMSYQN